MVSKANELYALEAELAVRRRDREQRYDAYGRATERVARLEQQKARALDRYSIAQQKFVEASKVVGDLRRQIEAIRGEAEQEIKAAEEAARAAAYEPIPDDERE